MKEVSRIICREMWKFQLLNVAKLAALNVTDPVNVTVGFQNPIEFAVGILNRNYCAENSELVSDGN